MNLENKGILIAILAVVVGLVVIAGFLSIATVAEGKEYNGKSNTNQIVVLKTSPEKTTEKELPELPQSLREQERIGMQTPGVIINNNIQVQSSNYNPHGYHGRYYDKYDRRYYGKHYRHYDYKRYNNRNYGYRHYREPKNYFHYSNSYGNYNRYAYY